MDGRQPATETRQLLAQWIEHTKRLLTVLPSCLDGLEESEKVAATFHQKVSELQQENDELRQSRDELEEILGQLRALILRQACGETPKGTPPQGSSGQGGVEHSAFEAAKLRRPPAIPAQEQASRPS